MSIMPTNNRLPRSLNANTKPDLDCLNLIADKLIVIVEYMKREAKINIQIVLQWTKIHALNYT